MHTQYLQNQMGTFRFSGPLKKLTSLPPGVYSASQDNFGEILLNPRETHTDELIALSSSPAEMIERDVDAFLSSEVKNKFERYNLVYKRGLLMYGPPGTGKTSIVHLLMRQAINKNMVVLLNPEPYLVLGIAESIREIEKTSRALMVVWEEFERFVADSQGDILDLLDGVDQVENVFFLATTNYIKQIPSRIRNRPSRFAEVVEIGPPNADLRRAYLEAKIHEDDFVDLDDWVEKTEGFTIDHLKDLVISVLALNIPLEKAIEKSRKLQEEDDLENTKSSLANALRALGGGKMEEPVAEVSLEPQR